MRSEGVLLAFQIISFRQPLEQRTNPIVGPSQRTNSPWVNCIGWFTTITVTLAAASLIWTWIR
jgi:hypothetical protein